MNRSILRNMSWIGLIQSANFILPFATLPYLARALLPEKFGTMSLALAIAAVLAIICDYGFNWSGVSQISAKRGRRDDLVRIFSEIVAAKILIFLIALLGLVFCVEFIPMLNRDSGVYLISLTLTFGAVFSPLWFLQGIERMFELAAATLGARLISIAAVYHFVNTPDDVEVATFLMAIPNLLSALAGLFFVQKIMGCFTIPKIKGVCQQLCDGWPIFIGTLTIGVYTTAQTVIVGALGGPAVAGYYASADKCMSAGKALLGVVTQASLPRVSYWAQHDPLRGLKLIHSFLWMSPAALCVSIAMIIAPEVIVSILFGSPFVESVAPLLRILSPIPIFVSLTSCFASLYMLNYGYRNLWSRMLVAASAISLLSTWLAFFWFPAHVAAAIGVVVAEGFVTVFSGVVFITSTKNKKALGK